MKVGRNRDVIIRFGLFRFNMQKICRISLLIIKIKELTNNLKMKFVLIHLAHDRRRFHESRRAFEEYPNKMSGHFSKVREK